MTQERDREKDGGAGGGGGGRAELWNTNGWGKSSQRERGGGRECPTLEKEETDSSSKHPR